MDNIELARVRLKRAILIIAKEIDFDVELAKAGTENLSKDELIEKYIMFKDLALQKENARLIDLLLVDVAEGR